MLEAGDQIRDYTLRRFLGQGSYGEVWLAERKIELADDCIPFALKFLIDQSAHGGDPEGVKNEVRTWIKAGNHFNIVPVYDGFIHGRFLIIVSEYIDGGSLRDWLVANNGKAPSLEKAVEMMRGILQGLTHLHSRKIIHRDLKPENILVKDRTPKITDFGVSRMVETFSQTGAPRYTKGAGAPLYMPPEAFSDGNPMPQLDTWSAGVMFYEMLSGEFPFNADSLPALLGEITNKEPRPLPLGFPEELQEFISLSLAKDVSQRFQTSEDMAEAFENLWADLEQQRKWKLKTVADGLPRKPTGGRREDVAIEQHKQVRYLEGSENQEIVPTEQMGVRRQNKGSLSEPKPERAAAVQRNNPPLKGLRKSTWVGIAVLTTVIIASAIWWLPRILPRVNSLGAPAALIRGKECFEKNDFDCAIASFTREIESNPYSAEGYISRGRAYFRKGEYDQAIKDFSSGIGLKPQYSDAYDAYTYRGASYGAKNNPDEAIKDLNQAIEMNPQFPKAYFNRGIANRAKGNRDQSIKDFDKAIELNPTDADTYHQRGLTYKETARNQAIRDFDKAIELNPQYGDSYNERGAAYLFEGNLDQAIKDLDKSIELNPKLADARYYRALAYGNKGNHDQAMRDFSNAIELNPEMAEAYAYRGTSYANKGDFAQALRDFDKAIELEPKMAEAYYNRGLAYGNRGDADHALKDFTKAIEVNPQYAQAYYARAVAYGNLRQAAKGRADFQSYRELSKK